MKNNLLVVALFLGWLTPICATAQGSVTLQPALNFHHSPASIANANDIVVVGSIQQVVSKHAPGTPAGTNLLLNSSQGVVDAHLGPYLSDDVRASLQKNQMVQVTGVFRTVNGKSYLLARQITVSGKQVNLRNEHGFLLRPEIPASSRQHKGQSEFNGGAL
jgi:hypothetical protein